MVAGIRSIVMTIRYSRDTMMVIPWCVIGRIPIAETTDPEANTASICTC
jgi:hypothetical protein